MGKQKNILVGIYMGTTNTKMDPSSANFYDAVRQNPLIRFEHAFARSNGNSKCWGGGLDSYTNLHEGDGIGTTAYGIR